MKILEVKNFSKSFVATKTPAERLMRWLTLGRGQYGETIQVVRNVSFDLKPGDAMMIYGPNGSGKSTLLKAICGALTPTSGTIRVKGRLGAIIELGIGLELEATGRENAKGYYSRILDPPFDEREFLQRVENYCRLGHYFDQEIKYYSSGMVARLAFAGSVAVRPDLLVVDEALSVGDASFQQTCLATIKEFTFQGTALIFVSHAKFEKDEFHFNKVARIIHGELFFENID